MTDQELLPLVDDFFTKEIKPKVQLDGGDVDLVEIKDAIIYVRFKGACVGCPFSFYTLVLGIQQRIQEQFPWVKKVTTVSS